MISLALLVAAVLLSATLVERRTNHITTYGDYSVTQTIAAPPLFIYDWEVVDAFCGAPNNCAFRAVATERGIFARDGVPHALAIIGGIVAPYVLVCIEGITALRRAQKRATLLSIAVLIFFGVITLAPVSYALFLAATGPGIDRFTQPEAVLMGMAASVGLTLVAAAAWLSHRGIRQHYMTIAGVAGFTLFSIGVVLLIRPGVDAYLMARYGDRVSLPPAFLKSDPMLVFVAGALIAGGALLRRRARRSAQLIQ